MSCAVALNNVTKVFDLIQDQHSSLKSAMLAFRRRTPKKLLALDNINCRIGHGETVAVVGRNGSGKSTMLGLIGRIYRPTSGSVEVSGRMCTMLDLGAGFHPELTGRENIYFNGAIMGLSTAEVRQKMDSIIEFSELNDFIDTPIKTYSAGMKMRLGFAIATQTDPDILLIDEVLAVGDAAFQQKCYKKIESFKGAGKTIVFVTHDLDAAKMVATRTIWIHLGKMMADGETHDVIARYLSGAEINEASAAREARK